MIESGIVSKKDFKCKENSMDVAKSVMQAWCQVHYQPVMDNPDEILTTPIYGNSLIRK